MTMNRTITDIHPAEFPWFPYRDYTFSLGLTDGQHAWLSGHSGSGMDADEGRLVVRGGMGEQARTVYAKLGTILEGAGLGFQDVVRVVENVTIAGIDDYAQAEQVRSEVFGDRTPAVVTVVVERLVRRQALIEIEVEASRGGGTLTHVGSADAHRWHRGTVCEADDVVHLPTLLPVDERGEVVAEGDLREQYRYCLERAAGLLEAVGLSLASVVKTLDYTTPATREEYSRVHRPRRELLGPVYPGSAGILMSRLHAPGVLVAVDVIASRTPGEVVNPGWSRYDTLSYSPGVKAGRNLFMSGFGALDMDTQQALYAGDLVAQAEHTYDGVLQVLQAAGAGPEHLVQTIEYVTPEALGDYRGVAGVRQRVLRAPWPASVGAVCGALLRPEFLIEVDPLAVLPA